MVHLSLRGVQAKTNTSRLLSRCDGSRLELSSVASVMWYCFISLFALALGSSALWCWYQKWVGQRSALEYERELEDVSRIESNVHAFTEAEKARRLHHMRATLKFQTTAMTDRRKLNVSKVDEGIEPSAASSCSICLEDFREGDLVAHAAASTCTHTYHEGCIATWLASMQHALCPCCRSPFLCLPTPKTSVASQDNGSAVSDESEPMQVSQRVPDSIEEETERLPDEKNTEGA